MTVKDIFELRKQGKTEEAYEAILPLYAEHKGKYTTIAMFWTAHDMLKKRISEQRTEEAVKIFKALLRMHGSVEDNEGRVRTAILEDAIRLSAASEDFFLMDYLAQLNLTEADWDSSISKNGNTLQPSALRILKRVLLEIQLMPTLDYALKILPLLEEAARRYPEHEDCRQCMSIVYEIMGETEKAKAMVPKQSEHLELGRWGEKTAITFLEKKGYKILHHDWHSAHRDIDIVAKDGETLVFVEVKTRKNRVFGEPEEAVDYKKRRCLQKSIHHYIKTYHCEEDTRFDIITVVGSMWETPEISHLENVAIMSRS